MRPRQVLLDYALLGLLATEGRSGYDLRKVFQETPLGHYSDSPGSIYPALARLEAAGLIRRRPGIGARNRSVLVTTAAGTKRLLTWLDAPVDLEMVRSARGAFELKLAFYSDHRSTAQLRRFLQDVITVLDQLHRQTVAAGEALDHDLSPSGRLALSLGVHLIAEKIAWVSNAIRSLQPQRGPA